MNSFQKSLTTLSIGLCLTVQADQLDCCESINRADDHAPISIMGDHTHKTNEWMLSYRYMQMEMDGMRRGNERISSNDVFAANYTVSPENMRMEMHMLGLMYAPTDRLTLMLMTNFTEIEMEHRIFPGAAPLIAVVGSDRFTTEASGLGDTTISTLYQLYEADGRSLIGSLGISLPTGSIDRTDRTPAPGAPPSFVERQLPASMQLGSGTFDLLPSLTYSKHFEKFAYGFQSKAVLRLENENSHGYRRGHAFEANSWISYLLDPSLSISSGLRYSYEGQLHGSQRGVGQNGPGTRDSVTTAFSENYGGESLELSFGSNYLFNKGPLKGHRLGAEIYLPVWQELNGLQLETDWTFVLGWQKAF